MPNKYELAQYLVNLHTLLEAQDAIAVQKSTAIADEYNTNWDLLKTAITKEKENETGNRNHRNLNESRADTSINQPRRGSPTRDNGDL